MNKQTGLGVRTVMEDILQLDMGWQETGLRLTGACLLFAAGAIHLDLYLTGYRSIPTIGGLFLLQLIVAFGLGAVVLVSGSRLASAAGAGFALSTLGGYLLSLRIGLFGFREIRTTAGIVAGVVDIATFATLGMFAIGTGVKQESTDTSLLAKLRADGRGVRWAIAAISVVAALALGICVAATEPTSTRSQTAVLKIATISGVTVLTDAQSFTLYWFAPDTSVTSKCSGTCVAYWPPLAGTPTAGPGVTGRVGTIKRSDGSTQATYNGHPLYTYVGDTAPGQANGNDLNLNGGVWHEMAASS